MGPRKVRLDAAHVLISVGGLLQVRSGTLSFPWSSRFGYVRGSSFGELGETNETDSMII